MYIETGSNFIFACIDHMKHLKLGESCICMSMEYCWN